MFGEVNVRELEKAAAFEGLKVYPEKSGARIGRTVLEVGIRDYDGQL